MNGLYRLAAESPGTVWVLVVLAVVAIVATCLAVPREGNDE